MGSLSKKFESTAWSVVAAALDSESGVSRAALEYLCSRYWPPLYTYVRLKGYAREDAEDLTQELFARLLGRDFLRNVDRRKGRFRTFLLACMDNLLRDEWQKSTRQKRGGRVPYIPIDQVVGEQQFEFLSSAGVDARQAFDRQWAETLLDVASVRLKTEYVAAGKDTLFATLSPYLFGPVEGSTYRETAAELGMSEGAVKVAVHRLRKRFAALTRQEVAETVEHDDEVKDELAYLIEVFSA
jgi:RNA polymerase sigma-70 factor (ECF subfamily)